MRQLSPTAGVVIAIVALAMPRQAWADDLVPVDIEIPAVVLDESINESGQVDDEIDLANLVQSAARGVTTVQEAPAIVTVVTQDDIRDRQFTSVEQIVDTVPGWMRLGAIHSQFPLLLARGQLQAALLLHDGVSLFDPSLNVATVSRVQPVETIKRIELITGPGGVLWGANALLGIINIITKDADDVDGVEANVTLGGGNGDRGLFRGYVMAGAPELLGGKLKAFGHASFETYEGPGLEMPAHLLSSSLPQPNQLDFYGPLTRGEPARSYIINLDGKLSYRKLQLRAQFPIVQRRTPLGFDGGAIREHIPEDTARDPVSGQLLCPETQPFYDPGDACSDKGHLNRDNQPNYYDRYLVAEYQTRSDSGASGVTLTGYLINFHRRIEPLMGGAALPGLLEGGISFTMPHMSYRVGGGANGDRAIGAVRLRYGAEVFHEWAPERDVGSRQGAGLQTTFDAPLDLAQLPLACPRDLDAGGNIVFVPGCPVTVAFPASRTIVGAYLDPQWRSDKLIIDVGGRVQVAPAFLGKQSYSVTPTFGGAVVYDLAPSWHAKLNVTQGFRPPIFDNTASNSAAVVIGGNPDLKVEQSTAAQAEINARLFRGERRIRELDFRADYSYTYLHNLIQIISGRYANTGDRGIHSVEFLGKLFLQGGHSLQLSYTWLEVASSDVGMLRSLPEHWVNLGGAISLVQDRLSATGTLRLIGAMEDPNRVVEYRDLAYDDLGHVVETGTMAPAFAVVTPSELTLDRLPPVADLSLGVTWVPMKRLDVQLTVQNVFNARYYQPDAFFSYEPRVELLPNPAEDLRAYLGATYRY